MKNSVEVYLDAPPISRSIHQLTDYSSYLLYSLCAMPLTTVQPGTSNVRPLGAESWESAQDYTEFKFILRNDLFWSNGERVCATDYYRAFNFIVLDKKNRFRSMLSDVVGYVAMVQGRSESLLGVECEENSIYFRLNKPNYFFPMYLSLLVFSPMNVEEKRIYCGAYMIDKMCDGYIGLIKNEHFEFDRKISPINKITFTYQVNPSDPFALEAFLQGDIDVTSDTSFPYDKYIEYLNSGIPIQESYVDIACVLAENKNVSTDLTKLIIHGIDRRRIIEKLYNAPGINCGYHHLFDRKKSIEDDYLHDRDFAFECAKKIDTSIVVSVAYEDFYPNLEILTIIADQLRDVGIKFEFLVEEYGARNIDSHFRLELRKSPIADPLLFYKNACKSKRITDCAESKKRFMALLDRYQVDDREDRRKLIAVEMDAILIKLGQYVPILTIPGIFLKNPIIKNEHLFVPGQIWYT